jgi:hypothetical protein
LEKRGWSLMILGYIKKLRGNLFLKNGWSTEHDTSQEHVRKLDQPFQHNKTSTSDDEKNKMHTKTPCPGKKLWINPKLYSVNSKII